MKQIVESQSVPYIISMPLVAFVYFAAALAEMYRAPFDMVEADSELVAGYFTEYSGMKFVMFFMAEYINLLAVAAVFTTLFLGGWSGPILPGYIWFFIKCFAFVFVVWWIRGTFPRFRIDHLLSFAWKFLVPLALVNLLVVGLVSSIMRPLLESASELAKNSLTGLALLGANIVVLLITLLVVWIGGRSSRSKRMRRIATRS